MPAVLPRRTFTTSEISGLWAKSTLDNLCGASLYCCVLEQALAMGRREES